MACKKGVTPHSYTKEQLEFLKVNYVTYSAKELTILFNEKFNLNHTPNRIKAVMSRYKFKSGRTGCFEKGNPAFNKGLKWDDYMSPEGQAKSLKTTFKHGSQPSKTLPAGSEYIDSRGDVYIKLETPKNDTRHGMWEKKSRWVYEQHYGKIPEGYKVAFLDADKLNFNINNLILVSNAEQGIACAKKLYSDNAELNKSGILLAKVINKINEKERK